MTQQQFGWQPQGGWEPPPKSPKRKMGGCLTAVVAFVGILIAASVIGALAGSESEQSTTATTRRAVVQDTIKEPATTATSDAPGLRDKVRDGKFEFVVSSFRCQSGKCQAAVRVENIGDEPQYMFADNQYLYDNRGRKFTAETTLDDLWINELNPGLTVRGTVVWKVPAEFKPDRLELHDSVFSGGVTVQL